MKAAPETDVLSDRSDKSDRGRGSGAGSHKIPA